MGDVAVLTWAHPRADNILEVVEAERKLVVPVAGICNGNGVLHPSIDETNVLQSSISEWQLLFHELTINIYICSETSITLIKKLRCHKPGSALNLSASFCGTLLPSPKTFPHFCPTSKCYHLCSFISIFYETVSSLWALNDVLKIPTFSVTIASNWST